MSAPTDVIFDMDGTLADVSAIRDAHLRPGNRNFDAFHAASIDAPPHQWVVDAARANHAAGGRNIIVTARNMAHRYTTLFWLVEQDVPYDAMYMRADGDTRKDDIVKTEILAAIRRDGFTPTRAFDDNPFVIAMWRTHGINVTVVPGWDDPTSPNAGAKP